MDLGWTVRWAAARALGAINADPDRTTAALQGALTDSMWQVRGAAALSLGNVRTPASINALSGALSDRVGAFCGLVAKWTTATAIMPADTPAMLRLCGML